MPQSIPRLDESSWEINGEHLTAWIGPDELLDIRAENDIWLLHYNKLSGATGVLIGSYGRIVDAQKAAKEWIGDL
jgi:hypothetical protein